MRILVAGVSIRYIACSAARAGHSVIALDCFCDLDLERCASKMAHLSLDELENSLKAYIQEFSPDALVLGTGLEELKINGIKVLNNPPDKAAMVSDKLWFAHWLEKKGFPFIPTLELVEHLRTSVIVKPRKGAGGIGCRYLNGTEELNFGEDMIVQPLVEGKPASSSVIANGREAVTIAINEQIIGAEWAGARGFEYVGNITPLEPDCPEIGEMAEEIIAELGLIGCNGVDFLLTKDGPVVVEVNPRFQGSLDAVELSMGINVFHAHQQAFQGLLPLKPQPEISAGRAIIYAEKDLRIEREMRGEWIRDVPRPGTFIKKGMPLCSLLAIGEGREATINELKNYALMLR